MDEIGGFAENIKMTTKSKRTGPVKPKLRGALHPFMKPVARLASLCLLALPVWAVGASLANSDAQDDDLAALHEQRTQEVLRDMAASGSAATAAPLRPLTPTSTEPVRPAVGPDHRGFRIREVAPSTKPLTFKEMQAGPGGLPLGKSGAIYLPEDWLVGDGQPWHYRSAPRAGVAPVAVRPPRVEEAKVIEQAQALMGRVESRAMVLIADGAIVEAISTGGIQFNTRLLSASMGKTVAALAAGKAVCAGHLKMDQRVDSLLPGLVGKDLGAATLRDVLMMASGTTEPS